MRSPATPMFPAAATIIRPGLTFGQNVRLYQREAVTSAWGVPVRPLYLTAVEAVKNPDQGVVAICREQDPCVSVAAKETPELYYSLQRELFAMAKAGIKRWRAELAERADDVAAMDALRNTMVKVMLLLTDADIDASRSVATSEELAWLDHAVSMRAFDIQHS